MITIKVSYECAECGAENIKQYACGNDDVFEVDIYYKDGKNENLAEIEESELEV